MAKIVLTGSPLSTNSLYRYTCAGNVPRLYMTDEGKARKKQYQWQAKTQWRNSLLDCPIKMSVFLFFKDKRKHDADNFNKILFDSCQGIIFEDDSQIQELHVYKGYDKENPRTEVHIECLSSA